MDTYRQRSGVEVRFNQIRDSSGLLTVPTTLHWRLSDEASGVVMQDWTAVTPQLVYTSGVLTDVIAVAEVPGPVNLMTDAGKKREIKVVTMVADKDTDREFSEELSYMLIPGNRG